jgi:Raf kinase inhibitor-like YbhB/YbcL family protein
MVRAVASGVLVVALVGCQASASPSASGPSSPAASGSAEASAGESAAGFVLTSSAFAEGGVIPVMYSCQGAEVSPPLAWSGGPEGTAAYVLIMEDPDADGFVHWVVVNLPGDAASLEEGASRAMPEGTIEGATSSGELWYLGPCPPSGEHRYVFTLYALSEALAVGAQPTQLTAEAVRGLIEGFVLDDAELTGTYSQ